MTRLRPILFAALAATATVALVAGSPAAGETDGAAVAPAPEAALDIAVSLADLGSVKPPAPPTAPDAGPKTPNYGAASFWCSYSSEVDRPHISRNGRDVSAHGWWTYRNGSCRTATVTLWLYHLRISPTRGYYWALTDTDVVRRMPRNAPLSQRANVRHTCQHQRTAVSFHVVVDVDIDGQIDPPDRPSKTANVNCVPW